MADQQQQFDPLFELVSQAGVRRDGTELDSPFFSDCVWTRFQRGKPRKIGGYVQLSNQLNSPIRSVLVDSRNGQDIGHYFGQWGIQRQLLAGLSATGLVDRTPVGYVPNANNTWSQGLMYSSTGGAYAALLASSTPDLADISSDTAGFVYAGDSKGTDPLVQVADSNGPIQVSGGLTVLQPFLFVYGSNGLIRNSNTNDFSTATGWTTGSSNFANSANPAGTKIVYGAPMRGGGQAPAGLFWALDTLIRVSFIGGTALWQYDTISSPTSILGKKTIVEVDGKFFWIGTDRFLFYNGIVQELPNNMNQNFFFDNLNYAWRNKVWGTKISRFGEIWWFYPRGSDTECNDAIIYNYRENTWYDAHCTRSAGQMVQTYTAPVWAGDEDTQATVALTLGLRLATNATTAAGNATLHFADTTGVANGMTVTGTNVPAGTTVSSHTGTTVVMSATATGSGIASPQPITFSTVTTSFLPGQTVTGGTTSATGVVVRMQDIQINLNNTTGTFNSTETITSVAGGHATIIAAPFAQTLTSVYAHETGYDKIVQSTAASIPASFQSCNFGFAIGAPYADTQQSINAMTRFVRIEPDLGQVGGMTVTLYGKSFANQAYSQLETHNFTEETNYVKFKAQERILVLEFASNTLGGFYQMGQILTDLEPGSERSNS